MAPVTVDPEKISEFEDADRFYTWLGANHASETELWIRIHKRASGLRSKSGKQRKPKRKPPICASQAIVPPATLPKS